LEFVIPELFWLGAGPLRLVSLIVYDVANQFTATIAFAVDAVHWAADSSPSSLWTSLGTRNDLLSAHASPIGALFQLSTSAPSPCS
jgi:hypothetical protein